MVITIDGPGGVGKSTVALAVARKFDLPYLDTGATYRAATVIALDSGIALDDGEAILAEISRRNIDYGADGILLDHEQIRAQTRTPEVTDGVSAVSAHPGVRSYIVAIQRSWVERHGGDAVVEGRDIGTTVFPNAKVKVYLTARPEVRAARRAGDSEARGTPVSQIAKALAARDQADSSRVTSPLRPADDAVVIDTSDIGIGQVVETIVGLVTDSGTPQAK